MRRLMESISKKYKLKLLVHEGIASLDPRDHPNMLFVTTLRDPIERAISHFKYDMRWSCSQLAMNKSFVPTLENANPISKRLVPYHCAGKRGRRCNRVWGCVSQCYTRWFANGDCECDIQKNVAESEEKLNRFHIILLTHMLEDPNYVKMIETALGDQFPKSRSMFCFYESKAANKKYPLHIDNETMHRLEELNQWDIRLYKKFSNCPNGFDFPTSNIFSNGKLL